MVLNRLTTTTATTTHTPPPSGPSNVLTLLDHLALSLFFASLSFSHCPLFRYVGPGALTCCDWYCRVECFESTCICKTPTMCILYISTSTDYSLPVCTVYYSLYLWRYMILLYRPLSVGVPEPPRIKAIIEETRPLSSQHIIGPGPLRCLILVIGRPLLGEH